MLSKPASDAQRERAKARAAESRAVACGLREQVGDPERVIDRHGSLPAERREWNLRSHMDLLRHRLLREWSGTDRRRFNALLKMPMPDPAAMCSECEAPTEWHEYDFSLRLFHPRPPAGSRAETMDRLMPGWWDRCPACTAYQIEHRWGGDRTLPDFTGEQWSAMLPPLLRTVFLPAPSKPIRKKTQPKPQPLAVIAPGPISEVTARLSEAQAKYPTARLRRGFGDSWELWPT